MSSENEKILKNLNEYFYVTLNVNKWIISMNKPIWPLTAVLLIIIYN